MGPVGEITFSPSRPRLRQVGRSEQQPADRYTGVQGKQPIQVQPFFT